MCSTGGNCKSSDRVYGIINAKASTLHRLTFSKSLADHLTTYNPDYTVRTFRYILGPKLGTGEISASGLYAITSNLSTSKELVLRISLDRETADLLTSDQYRSLHEAWIIPD